ncbi:MAG: sulfotransferase [Xanthomonadales bacterium]|nr:sulfotransferase [Xanthomonadales bacterium]
MLELSYVESLAGNYRIARDWALRAAALESHSIDGRVSLVQRLRTFNEVPVLRGLVARWLCDVPPATPLLVECARQLINLNDFDSAQQCADLAAVTAPEDLSVRLVRGLLLAHRGRIDEAAADFNWALRRNPRIALAWWLLARLQTQTAQSNHVEQLQMLLRIPGLQPSDVAALARALHKELDDLGDHSGAWQALEWMGRAKRCIEPYDSKEGRAVVDALIEWSSRRSAETAQHEGGRTPLFVLGMYRSGTTLLAQMLDGSPEVLGLGELCDFSSAMRHATDHYSRDVIDRVTVARAASVDFTEVGRRYLDGIAWRLGDEPFFIDKLPANFLNIGFICRALPQAKILHMVRDPLETCFSNLRELFTGINAYSYDQLQLADYFIQYRRLMAHWHGLHPGRILDIDYAELTRDPEAVMRKVAAFCGVGFIEAMSDPRSSTRPVSTASGVQVRDRVVRRQSPKWLPYAEYLKPLIQALREGGVEIREPPT